MVYDCPITKIESVALRLYGYATYPTMNNASFMENHIDEMPQTMQMTLYFAICHVSCPEKVFKMLPCQPPDGFITEGLTVSIIRAIYSIIIFQAWIQILIIYTNKKVSVSVCTINSTYVAISVCHSTIPSAIHSVCCFAIPAIIFIAACGGATSTV